MFEDRVSSFYANACIFHAMKSLIKITGHAVAHYLYGTQDRYLTDTDCVHVCAWNKHTPTPTWNINIVCIYTERVCV